MFDCEYCLSGVHESVIECERCNKWGCPECTDISPDIHKLLGKWGSLHWYCKACEVLIKAFCNQGDTDMQSSISNTDISEARSLRLEGMMAKLEKIMGWPVSEEWRSGEVLCTDCKDQHSQQTATIWAWVKCVIPGDGVCVCCSGSVITHSLTGKHICMLLCENNKYRLLDITIYSLNMVFKTWYFIHNK